MCRAAQPLRRSAVHLFFFPLLPSSFSSLSLVQRRRAGGRKTLASHRHASSICFNVWRIQRRVRHNLLASIDLCGRYQQFALPQKRVHSRNPLLFDFMSHRSSLEWHLVPQMRMRAQRSSVSQSGALHPHALKLSCAP